MAATLEPIGQGPSHQHDGGILGVIGAKLYFIILVTEAETKLFRGSVIGEVLDDEQLHDLSGRVFVESRIVRVFDAVIDVAELIANHIGTVGVSASQKVRTEDSPSR